MRIPPDHFQQNRPPFLVNSLILALCMVLYPIIGILLIPLFSGGPLVVSGQEGGLVELLGMLRWTQALGQLLVLALPVLLLAGLHLRKAPFSRESFSFLGIGKPIDLQLAALALVGIFLLQPLVYTLTGLQELFLWPALGAFGQEVLRQQELMEAFLSELALSRTLGEFLAVVLVLAVVPAVTEELFFRGYVQQNYAASIRPVGAMVLTGILFALFHLNVANLLPLTLLGWYIGYIYVASGNLMVPIAVHLANNLVALLLLLTGAEEALQVEPVLMVASPAWWITQGGTLVVFAFVIRLFAVRAAAVLSES